jgi:prolipoprotein diacylglyceryltransferase
LIGGAIVGAIPGAILAGLIASEFTASPVFESLDVVLRALPLCGGIFRV